MGQEKEKGAEPHVSGQANKPMSRPAHALTYEQVVQELGSDALNGLSSEDAKQRLGVYGANDLGESKGVSPLRIVIAQIANAMTLVSLPPIHQMYILLNLITNNRERRS
jgi:P-type Na+/K+ transporter